MRISSKKILAIVLSVAMLVSCMVFSFSASAATTWNAKFDNAADATFFNKAGYNASNFSYATVTYAQGGRGDSAGALKLSALKSSSIYGGFRIPTGAYSGDAPSFGSAVAGTAYVTFWYKPVTVTADTGLYVFTGSFPWLSYEYGVDQLGPNKVRIATVTADQVGEWHMATASINSTAAGMHIAFSLAADTEILIDDITVTMYATGESVKMANINYIYNETVVATRSGVVGQYHNHAQVALPLTAPEGYTVALYSDAERTVRLTEDVVMVAEDDVNVYVGSAGGAEQVELLWAQYNGNYINDFESVTIDGAQLNIGATGTASYVEGEKNHTPKNGASKAIKINSGDGSGNGRGQINLVSANGDYIRVKKGASYTVSFWLYLVPDASKTESHTNIWLAATEEDRRFPSSATSGTDDHKSTWLISDEKNSYELTPGMWNYVTFNVPASKTVDKVDGMAMRLGIGASTKKSPSQYYIDDVMVKENVTTSVWDFEDVALGNDLDQKGNDAYVSSDVSYSGTNSLFISNSNPGNGRDRTQIYLKDGSGNAVTVEKGKTYFVSFWAYVPNKSSDNIELNMWFAGGDGSAVRPSNSGNGTLAGLFLDDRWYTGADLVKNAGWTKITRKFTVNVDLADNQTWLLMSLGEGTTGKRGTCLYIDDISVVCADDIVLDQTANDREQYLFEATLEDGRKTNLHYSTANTEDKGLYTSIRLGATYKSGDISGKSIVLDGVAYDIVERGIVVGVADTEITVDNCKWKSVKSSGLDTYWDKMVNSAGANDPTDVTFTLRLANMSESWFDGTGTDAQKASYQYRSYYKVKQPYYAASDAYNPTTKDETIVLYGGTSEAFTFAQLKGDFESAGLISQWFPSES